MIETRCDFCGDPVDPDAPTTWRKITAYAHTAGVRESGKHGGSDVALREPINGFAHTRCVRREQQGVSARQESLE